MSYVSDLKYYLGNLDLKDIIQISEQNLSNLSHPWEGLNHGKKILETEQELLKYIVAYGEMHRKKLVEAFENFPYSDIENKNVELVDWGCGQGIASVFAYNRIKKYANVKRVTLIEPSKCAIERAIQNVSCATFNKCEIIPKCVSLSGSLAERLSLGIKCNYVIHLFSNILDVDDVNKISIASRISNYGRYNYVVAVGPQNQNESEIDEFQRLIDDNNFETKIIHSYSGGLGNLENGHLVTCKTRSFNFINYDIPEIVAVPVINRFWIDSKRGLYYQGETIRLCWQVSNCSDVFLNGDLMDNNQTSLLYTFDKAGEYKFKLIAQNKYKRVESDFLIIKVEVADPVIVNFRYKTSKSEITQGDTLTFSWTAENYDSIFFDGHKVFSGENVREIQVKNYGESIHTLEVHNADKVVTKECQIIAKPHKPIIQRFVIENPKSDYDTGDDVLFKWNTDYCESIEFNHVYLSRFENSYLQNLTQSGILNFSLIARNGDVSTEENIEIKVNKAPCLTLLFSKDIIAKGDTVKLEWLVNDCKSKTASLKYNSTSKEVDLNGELVISPQFSTKYSISVVGESGKTYTKTTWVTVVEEIDAEFSLDRIYTFPNVPVVASWNVLNAYSVEINGEKNPPQGKKELYLEHNQMFTLRATDLLGRVVEKKIEAKVMELKEIKNLKVSVPHFVSIMHIKQKTNNLDYKVELPEINISGMNLVKLFPRFKKLKTPLCSLNLWQRVKLAWKILNNKLTEINIEH